MGDGWDCELAGKEEDSEVEFGQEDDDGGNQERNKKGADTWRGGVEINQ